MADETTNEDVTDETAPDETAVAEPTATTAVLRVGNEVRIGGVPVKIIKCGMHREGNNPPCQTVTIEVDGEFVPPVVDDPEDSDE